MENSITSHFQNNGYEEFSLGVFDITQSVLKGFLQFLAEDLEYKKSWTFQIDRKENPEIGYVPREASINLMTGYPYDYKDVFHFDPKLVSRLKERGVDFQRYKNWLDDLSILYKKSEEKSERVLGEMSLLSHPLIKKENHVLRLLHYHMKDRKEGVIGLGHTDESILTLGITENFPGLKVGEKGNTEFLKRGPEVSILYPGKKLELITLGKAKALYHEIVRYPNLENFPDAIGYPHRLSIVFFY